MHKLVSILGLILTLATLIIAPVQDAYAGVVAATSPVMKMADGSPCTSQSCAKMPDCPMVLPCVTVPGAVMGTTGSPDFLPIVLIERFSFQNQANLPSLTGSGLRRPPKV